MSFKRRAKRVTRDIATIRYGKVTFDCHSGRTKSDRSHSGNEKKHTHKGKPRKSKVKWKPKKK